METFDYLYRRLAYATVAMLVAAMCLFGVTLVCAVLGFAHAVATLNGVTLSVAFVFGGLLVLFLVSSLVRGLVYMMLARQDTGL